MPIVISDEPLGEYPDQPLPPLSADALKAIWQAKHHEFVVKAPMRSVSMYQAFELLAAAYAACMKCVGELQREQLYGTGRLVGALELEHGDYVLDPSEVLLGMYQIIGITQPQPLMIKALLRPCESTGDQLDAITEYWQGSPADLLVVYRKD